MTASNPEPDAEKPLIAQDATSLVQKLHLLGTSPLILVSGPPRVGKSRFIDEAMASRLARFCHGHRIAKVIVGHDEAVAGIAVRCVKAIFKAHPVLARYHARNAEACERRRKNLIELAESNPAEAGRKLLSFIRGLEKGTSGKLKDVSLLLHLDGLDRFYQFEPGRDDSIFEFVNEILGVRSVLVATSFRSWAGDLIGNAIENSGISSKDVVRETLTWPKAEKFSYAVSRKISNKDRAERIVHEFASSPPASYQHLPAVVKKNGVTLSDHIEAIAEKFYTGLSSEERGGVPRIFQRLASSSNGRKILPANEISRDAHLWHVANRLVDGGILTLSGDSLKTAEFSPVSDSLFKNWERAKRWTSEASTPASAKNGVAQTDQFENHALSWQTNERDPGLLLRVDESLEKARALLAQHAGKPILSPLALEFLEQSVHFAETDSRKRKLLKDIGLSSAAGIAAVIALTLVIRHFQANGSEKKVPALAQKTPVASDGLVSEPAPLPIEPDAPIEKTPASAEKEATPAASPPEKPVLDEDLRLLARKIAGGLEIPLPNSSSSSETEADSPGEESPTEPPAPAAVSIFVPENFQRSATPAEILTETGNALANGDSDRALEALRFLYDRAQTDRDARPNSSDLRQLIVNLGKVALLQRDQKAAQSAWKLGMNVKASSSFGKSNPVPDDVRLLMARVAANAGRNQDAATFLFGPSGAETHAEHAEAILDVEFGSKTRSDLPKLDQRIIDELPVSEALKNQLGIDG